MKVNHKILFSHALRSALLFVAGFLIYDILVTLEKFYNAINPNNELYHFYIRHILKLILIFIIDLLILYGLAFSIGF